MESNINGFHSEAGEDVLEMQDRAPEPKISGGTNGSNEVLAKEFAGPVKTSDSAPLAQEPTPAPEPVKTGSNWFSFPKPAPTEEPAPPAPKPIFIEPGDDFDTKVGHDDSSLQPDGGKRSDDTLVDQAAKDNTARLLRTEEFLKSTLLKFYSLSGSREPFTYPERDFKELVEVCAPLVGKMKVPVGLQAASIYIAANQPIIALAMRMRRENLRIRELEDRNRELEEQNEQLKNSEAVRDTLKKAKQEESTQNKERTLYRIDAQGYYFEDRYGNYVTEQSEREKADLKDIAKIVKRNGYAKVQKAFGITVEDYNKYKAEVEE